NCALYFMVLGSGNAVVSQLFCGRRVLGFGDENAGRPSLVVKLCRFASAPGLAATQDFHGVCLMERVGNYQKGRHPGQDRLSKEIRSSPCRQEKQNRNEQNVPVFLRHRFLSLSINRTGEYKSFKCLKRSASRKQRFGVQPLGCTDSAQVKAPPIAPRGASEVVQSRDRVISFAGWGSQPIRMCCRNVP